MNFPDFQLLQDVAVPSLQARACLYRHRSGLEVFCLNNSDRENLFALHISTPPSDNTGVPHIIEHTVLSGSRKFPLKDPFIELVKSSLATFINAMTFPDFTVYPVCSCHPKDFFNLAEVYWDAVFHPLLRKSSFQQEGWHYELGQDRKGNPRLEINGIVLNEMSGAWTEMDNVLERSVYQYLLPDTHLTFDSGGHPDHIPLLSYQNFLKYYQAHYQPEKAKVIFTGNIPLEDKLDFLRSQLQGVPDAVGPAKSAPRHFPCRQWRVPRVKRVRYVPEPDDANTDACAFVLAWRIDNRRNQQLDLTMQLLDLILLGNSGAPLSKRLLESGLCSTLTSCGFDDNCFQTLFQIGVRGCKAENFDRLQQLILECLEEQSRGISKNRIQAALRQLRMDHAEISTDYNLDILEDILAAWNYGYDPVLFLNQEKNWLDLENSLAGDSTFLEQLLKQYFLDNPQRLRLELLPDPELLSRREKRGAARLRDIQSTLTPIQLQRIQQEQQSLRKNQQRMDPAATRSTLPRLRREDLSAQPPQLPVRECLLGNGLSLLTGEVFTNQVSYLQIAFDLAGLPGHLQPLLPFFSNFFHQTGTTRATYDVMAEKQALASTSIRASLHVCDSANGQNGSKKLFCLSLQTLESCLPEALEILQEQLREKTFGETKRCQEILRQHWAHILSDLQSNGQGFATLRGAAGLTDAASLLDDWNGLPHVRNCRIWRDLKPEHFRQKLELLDELAAWLAQQTPIIAACAGDTTTLQKISQFLEPLPTPPKPNPANNAAALPPQTGRREFFPLNADVSCFARVIKAPHFMHPDSAALEIYAQLLSCGHLWREVRMKNGAYGVHCHYAPFSRTLLLQSSDDPNPGCTRTIFDSLPSAGVVRSWTDRDISDGVIACSRGNERPWRPAQIVHAALRNRIAGLTEELRAGRRRSLLEQTPGTVRDTATRFWSEFSAQHNDCLLGPAECAQQLGFSPFQI